MTHTFSCRYLRQRDLGAARTGGESEAAETVKLTELSTKPGHSSKYSIRGTQAAEAQGARRQTKYPIQTHTASMGDREKQDERHGRGQQKRESQERAASRQ